MIKSNFVTGCHDYGYAVYYFETLSSPLGACRTSIFPEDNVRKKEICNMCIKNKGSRIISGPCDFRRASFRQTNTHSLGEACSNMRSLCFVSYREIVSQKD